MRTIAYYIIILTVFVIISCNRSGLLNEKPSSSLVVPKTEKDLQALMDQASLMNINPHLCDVSADEYFLTDADYNGNSVSAIDRWASIWEKDIFLATDNVAAWNAPYQAITTSNIVMELIKENFGDNPPVSIQRIKGQAHFFRAFFNFSLVSQFAPPYKPETAKTDWGIPLRKGSALNEKLNRATVEDSYQLIIEDLNTAISLLPPEFPAANRNRPFKGSAYALLSRVYLSMRSYPLAALNANKSLELYSTLIDYKTLSQTSSNPTVSTNAETLFQCNTMTGSAIFHNITGVANIRPELYEMYEPNDLRKIIFFRSVGTNFRLKGTYSGSVYNFAGLAVDEMYLTRAECYARDGNADLAMQDLNTLLATRYETGYINKTAATSEIALDIILNERRKQLLARGIRWMDLRRLNLENRNITLQRTIGGNTYTLQPNSSRYVLPIPGQAMGYNDWPQNER